jgi:hypothetical protein
MSVFPRNTLFLFEIFEILWYNIYTKMRGEKKMITSDFVFGLIDGITKRFEGKEEGLLSRWHCEEEIPGEVIDFVLDSEIKMALDCLNVKNCVEAVCINESENAAFDTYAICVSFIVDNELYQKVIIAHEY